MKVRFFNVHSHLKAQIPEEFVCRNAYHFLSNHSLDCIDYPVSLGIHPWHAHFFSDQLLEKIRQLAGNPKVLALGEAGIDKRHGPEQSIQMICWEAQWKLAQELKMPLIVHCVRAWQEMIPFLRSSTVPVLLHDFRGNEGVLRSLLPLAQVYFSFGRSLFQSPKSREVFCCIPKNRILLETDQATISIAAVYEQASLLSGMQTEEFICQMKKNSIAFFGEKALPFF